MALYHFHVSRMPRSRGQSCVEAAAYRAGERLEDSYYGKIADYTAKGGVICSEILTPDYVPESFHNREYLWNAVEEIEKHPKAQLAYSFDFALQNEFSMEENIALARRFVLENFVAKGMIADMAVHDPDKYGGIPNSHVHVLCPIRPMNEDGTWGGQRKLPYAFTEQEIYMLATVLKGDLATQQSIFIMRAFKEMRHFISNNALMFERINSIELRQLEYQKDTDDIENIVKKAQQTST